MFDKSSPRSLEGREYAKSCDTPGLSDSFTLNTARPPSASRPLSDIDALRFLHRAEDSVVTLHRKHNGHWENLGAVTTRNVSEELPLVRDFLQFDSYFLINSTSLRPRFPTLSPLTKLPLCSRRTERLRWLNALHVDLDIGHQGESVSFEDLQNSFFAEVSRIGMPIPSLLVSSGRGMWALWRLADHANRSQPVPAFADRIEIFRRVERGLATCFKALGADQATFDAARVMRVPNSINTKADVDRSRVLFYKACEDVHTMLEIASAIGVAARKTVVRSKCPRKDGEKDQAKAKAGITRWTKQKDGFLRLWALRGSFGVGVRHNALLIYAFFLRRTHASENEIVEECQKLAASCAQPLHEGDIRRCIFSADKLCSLGFERSMSMETIVCKLGITPEERAQIPEWFPARPTVRNYRITSRRTKIVQELLSAGCFVPDRRCWTSTRDMSRLLASKHGIVISHVVLAKDYLAIQREHFTVPDEPPAGETVNFRGG